MSEPTFASAAAASQTIVTTIVFREPDDGGEGWTKVIDGRVSIERGWVRFSEDLPAGEILPAGTRTVWIPSDRVDVVTVEVRGEDQF